MVKYEDGTVKYVGEVFNEYEQNYPDDSYWYIEAFHDGKVVRELVGTTAAGSVGVSNYTIDITEENKKALERYYHREEVKRLWGIRAKLKAEAVNAKCSYHELKKLYYSLSWKEYDACLTLLNTKKFRSSFRESLANQIRAWMAQDREEQTWPKPLSPKQFGYIIRNNPYERFWM